MSIHIRPAVRADVDCLVSFNAALAKETEGRELNRQRLRSGVESLIQDSHKGWYVVAEVESPHSTKQVVGQLLITYEWSDWRNGMFWWIQSLYVVPTHRRIGVFRDLFQYVCAQARTSSHPVCGVRLYVECENISAQQAYASLGFQEAHYKMFEQEFV